MYQKKPFLYDNYYARSWLAEILYPQECTRSLQKNQIKAFKKPIIKLHTCSCGLLWTFYKNTSGFAAATLRNSRFATARRFRPPAPRLRYQLILPDPYSPTPTPRLLLPESYIFRYSTSALLFQQLDPHTQPTNQIIKHEKMIKLNILKT